MSSVKFLFLILKQYLFYLPMILWFRNSGRAQLGSSSPRMLAGAIHLAILGWWFGWIL